MTRLEANTTDYTEPPVKNLFMVSRSRGTDIYPWLGIGGTFNRISAPNTVPKLEYGDFLFYIGIASYKDIYNGVPYGGGGIKEYAHRFLHLPSGMTLFICQLEHSWVQPVPFYPF